MLELFRPEARPQAASEIGFPLGVTSRWMKLYTLALALVILAAAAGTVFGSYSRKVLVSGFLIPDKGLIKIEPPRSGRITEQLVEDGQHVEKDQPLFVLDVSDVIHEGRSVDLLKQNLRDQRQLIIDELQHLTISQKAETENLRASIETLGQQIHDLQIELTSRRNFEKITQDIFERTKTLVTGNAASITSKDQAEQALAEAHTQVAVLETQLTTVKGQFAQAEADQQGLSDKQANVRLELDRTRSQIDQQLLQLEEQGSLVIRASQSGFVTHVTAFVGTNINTLTTPITPLLTIMPDNAVLKAFLYVPSSAIGFARNGATALIRYEAFPYEKFGLQEATVTAISRTAVTGHELPFPISGDDPYYVVTAALAKNTVTAFGMEEPLQAGMKFQADLVLEKRRLWEWVIEPILASRHSL